MAFALTAAYMYPELIRSAVANRHADQVIEIEFTSTVADVALDVGNLSGTFWTAVSASTMGASVLAALTLLYPQFSTAGCQSLHSNQLLAKIQSAAAAGAGEYAIALNGTTFLPSIVLHTGEGITTGQLRMVCRLNNGQLGMTFVYPPAS